jgi:hypothetical protein
MFVLGSVILYPQSRVELSVLRQQMIESGGKKILLNAVDAGSEDAETIFYQSLDKTLDNLRKVFMYILFSLKATDFRSALLLGHKECNRSFQQRQVCGIGTTILQKWDSNVSFAFRDLVLSSSSARYFATLVWNYFPATCDVLAGRTVALCAQQHAHYRDQRRGNMQSYWG